MICILIKETNEVLRYYGSPLTNAGLEWESLQIPYPSNGKLSASFCKALCEDVLEQTDADTFFVCDANLFKYITKQSATKSLGKPFNGVIKGWETKTIVYGISYRQLQYSDVTEQLMMSVDTLIKIAKGTYKATEVLLNPQYPDSTTKIKEALDKLYDFPVLAIDIETTSLFFRDAEIVSIAFAWDKNHGLAFMVDGVNKHLIKEFLTNYKGKLIGHNLNYDFKVLIYKLWMSGPLDTVGLLEGLDVLTRDFDDTKILAYINLNTTAQISYSLKSLAQIYMGNWAEDVTDVLSIPKEDLLKYNLSDTVATMYLYSKYRVDNSSVIIHQLLLDTARLLLQVELTGMPVNPKRVEEVSEKINDTLGTLTQLILGLKEVEAVEGILAYKAMVKYNQNHKKQKTEEDFRIPFNPNSNQHLAILLYEVLELPVLSTTKSGEPSTSGATLKDLYNLSKIEILLVFMEYFKYAKINSAFIPVLQNAWIKEGHGYIHGTFNIGGTLSGRLSSSSPNMQQLPASGELGKLIKSCFNTPVGQVMVGADFNALEDYINTLLTRDSNKMKVYLNHYDGHCLRAYSYFKDEMPLITKQLEHLETLKDGDIYMSVNEDGSYLFTNQS